MPAFYSPWKFNPFWSSIQGWPCVALHALPPVKEDTKKVSTVHFSSVTQSVWLFGIPRTATRQATLSITNSQSLTQTHVRWVSDAIRPSHLLSPPSPPAFNLSQHQGLFQCVSSSHQVAKVLEFQLQHQSFQ